MKDDIAGYKALIAEVVSQAIKDSMLAPLNNRYGVSGAKHAMSAMQFIYGGDVDVWLEWLDIDGNVFRKQIDKVMFSNEKTNFIAGAHSPLEIDDRRRRFFKINYQLWQKRKASYALGIDLEDDDE